MYHNDSFWPSSSHEKSKRHRSKKSHKRSHSHKISDIPKVSKHSKKQKPQKRHKLCNFKHMNTVSEYLGPERLTKHVGFFSKGKISDSISRFKKVASKEMKARARQDLREVLELTCSGKCKRKKHFKNSVDIHCRSASSHVLSSLQSNNKSPQDLHPKTKFAGDSWTEKLQKSVGPAVVNSVLDSVHEPQKLPANKEMQSITRKVLLTEIYPFIKEINYKLFPGPSNESEIIKKLRLISKMFPYTPLAPEKRYSSGFSENSHISLGPSSTVRAEKGSSSGFSENSHSSLVNEETVNTCSFVADDFHLSPIFTGDVMVENDITNIFPNVNEYMKNGTDDFRNDSDVDILQSEIGCYETVSSERLSHSIDERNSVALVPTSPATSDDSPVWRLQISPPALFIPEVCSTPTLYYRHKMF